MPPPSDSLIELRSVFPALALGVAAVHPVEFPGEQRGFIAARPRADFNKDVFLVIGVLRHQQRLKLGRLGHQRLAQGGQFLASQRRHIGVAIGQQGFMAGDFFSQPLVFRIRGHQRFHFGSLARQISDFFKRATFGGLGDALL